MRYWMMVFLIGLVSASPLSGEMPIPSADQVLDRLRANYWYGETDEEKEFWEWGSKRSEALAAEIDKLPDEQQVARWWALVEDWLAGEAQEGDFRNEIRFDDLIVAIPDARHWPTLRKKIDARPAPQERVVRDRVVRLMIHTLVNDQKAVAADRAALREMVDRVPEESRELFLEYVTERTDEAKDVTRDEETDEPDHNERDALARFDEDWAKLDEWKVWDSFRVPDLVRFRGEAEARKKLTPILMRGIEISSIRGEATEALIRHLIAKHADQIARPYWEWQNPGKDQAVFERLHARFAPGKKLPDGLYNDTYDHERAAVTYLWALLKAGREMDAARHFATWQAADPESPLDLDGPFHIAYDEREARDAALGRFVIARLTGEESVRFLNEVFEAATDAESMMTLASHLKKRMRPLDHRNDAFWEMEWLYIRVLREGTDPRRGFEQWKTRVERAFQTERIDPVTERTQFIDEAIALAHAADRAGNKDARIFGMAYVRGLTIDELAGPSDKRTGGRLHLYLELLEKDRAYDRLGRLAMEMLARGIDPAEDWAIEIFDEDDEVASDQSEFDFPVNPKAVRARYRATMYLVKIYHLAGRHEDVLKMARTLPFWEAGDLAELDMDDLHVWIGQALLARGKAEAARPIAERLAREWPKQDAGWQMLLEISPEAVLKMVERHALAYPTLGHPWVWAARAHLKLGDLQAAEQAARRAVKLRPEEGWIVDVPILRPQRALAAVLAAQGGHDEERASLHRRIAAAESRRRATTVQQAEAVVEMDPTYATGWADLAERYAQAGAMEKQREALLQFARYLPDVAAGSHWSFEFEGQTLAEAEKIWRDRLTREPDHAGLHLLLGIAHSKREQWHEAGEHWRKAAAADPDFLLPRIRLLETHPDHGVPGPVMAAIEMDAQRLDPTGGIRNGRTPDIFCGDSFRIGLDHIADFEKMWHTAITARRAMTRPVPPESLFRFDAAAKIHAVVKDVKYIHLLGWQTDVSNDLDPYGRSYPRALPRCPRDWLTRSTTMWQLRRLASVAEMAN